MGGRGKQQENTRHQQRPITLTDSAYNWHK